MEEKTIHDITNMEDIEVMVNSFYDKIKNDELLGPVFNEKIKDWSKHLPLMYSFWGSMLLATRTYSGNAYDKHAQLPIDAFHFERWIDIFINNIDENFAGKVADLAKFFAKNVSSNFQARKGLVLTEDQLKKIETSGI